MPNPNLNQADLDLLKQVFATKTDLSRMEKRQDAKYATKVDLSRMEKRQNAKYATKADLNPVNKTLKKIAKDVSALIKYFDQQDTNIHKRLDRIDDHLGLPLLSSV